MKSVKRLRQDINARLAILGDYIEQTTKELNESIEEYKELKTKLEELKDD